MSLLGAASRPLPFAALIWAALLPSTLAAQTWRELHDRGEYEQASVLLHRTIFERSNSPAGSPDVDALEGLARLYFHGHGVPQDSVLACSFASWAAPEAAMQLQTRHHPEVNRLYQLEQTICGPLPVREREFAAQMRGCPKFGSDLQVFPLNQDRSVELDRRGIRIVDRGEEQPGEYPAMCFERIAMVRHRRVDPPPGAAPKVVARDFIEVFSWLPHHLAGFRDRVLHFTLLEAAGRKVQMRERLELAIQQGWSWGPMPLGPDLTHVTFEMSRTGEVTWRSSAPGKGGYVPAVPIELPPDVPDELPPLPTIGVASVEVTVVDAFGALLAGATVKLTGVVNRERQTNEAGSVRFDHLPDGRYDVMAFQKELAASAPRVIDLSGPTGASVEFTLKRSAGGTVLLACGPSTGRSLEELAAKSDAVVHVKIESQHSYEGERFSPDDLRPPIRTSSEARALQTFKGAVSGSLTVVQLGGQIDRGTHIDAFTFSNLRTLFVGDEYVVFLERDDKGEVRVYGAGEGAFRIRNGRVDPLAEGEVAQAWKGRSAAKFFEALRTRISR